MDDIELGVLIPIGQSQWGQGIDPRELLDFAVRAEELGYSSLWVNDFLLTPRVEALTMLAAVAPLTSRVTLGTAALLPVLRRPVQAAQTLASIDLLSGGRLVLTVGAAFPGRFGVPQHELSEVPWERRFTRLDETVALWRQLWADPAGGGSFHGSLLRFEQLPEMTAPSRPGGPPVWLGGAAPAALDRTGRLYDGWLPYPPDPADYRAGLDRVRHSAAAAGRAGAVTPALFVSVRITDAPDGGRQAMSDYAAANYGLSLEGLQAIQALVAGPAEHVAGQLARYLDAGARHLVCRIAAADLPAQHQQLGRLAELLPALGRAQPGTAQPEPAFPA